MTNTGAGITNRTASLHLGSFVGRSSSFFLRNVLLISFLTVQKAVQEGGEKVDRQRAVLWYSSLSLVSKN